jgi:hypothetical protein
MSGVTCAFRNISIRWCSEVKRRPKIEIRAGALLSCSAAFYSDLWIAYQMEIEEVKTRQPLQKSQWDFLSQAQTATNSKECLRRKSGSGFY